MSKSKFDGLLKAKGASRKGAAPPSKDVSGRPAGKSASADYTQVTAYIRRETHQAAKVALIQEGGGRDFSELVEELVAAWLESGKRKVA